MRSALLPAGEKREYAASLALPAFICICEKFRHYGTSAHPLEPVAIFRAATGLQSIENLFDKLNYSHNLFQFNDNYDYIE
jgi:hypothetical protein